MTIILSFLAGLLVAIIMERLHYQPKAIRRAVEAMEGEATRNAARQFEIWKGVWLKTESEKVLHREMRMRNRREIFRTPEYGPAEAVPHYRDDGSVGVHELPRKIKPEANPLRPIADAMDSAADLKGKTIFHNETTRDVWFKFPDIQFPKKPTP